LRPLAETEYTTNNQHRKGIIMDKLPVIRLDLGGKDFEATPYNATFFTFLGKTVLESGDTIENSSRNHVFLETGEPRMNETGQEVQTGTYIFTPHTVQALGSIMLNNGFPAILNKREIPRCDEDAYQQYIAQQVSADEIPDNFPEEWK
jgi:hypothetical protein